MFNGCSSLKILNISNINILPQANISHIFDGCFALKEVNCSNNLIMDEYLKHLNLLNTEKGN